MFLSLLLTRFGKSYVTQKHCQKQIIFCNILLRFCRDRALFVANRTLFSKNLNTKLKYLQNKQYKFIFLSICLIKRKLSNSLIQFSKEYLIFLAHNLPHSISLIFRHFAICKRLHSNNKRKQTFKNRLIFLHRRIFASTMIDNNSSIEN